METDKKRMSETFYIITLHSTKRNSSLLDTNRSLRKHVRRNVDYSIIPHSAWMECREQYDTEIPVCNIYNLFISFSCHGLSYKNIYVHGVEVVFDVVQALFVNKMFGIESFRKMFEVKWNAQKIDPMVSFEWFGSDSKKIILTVERKAGYVREEPSGVLDSIMVNDPESSFNSFPERKTGTDTLNVPAKNSLLTKPAVPEADIDHVKHRVTREDISFYKKIYTNAREIYGKSHISQSYESFGERRSSGDLETGKSSYSNSNHSIGVDIGEDREWRKPQNPDPPAYVHPMHQESVGLVNIGNTCYMNSSIQCLNNCMTFSNFFVYYHSAFDQIGSVEKPFRELCYNTHFHTNSSILSSWANLTIALNTRSIASPKDLKIAIGAKNAIFQDFKEQDAAEFIEAILTYLHEGLCYQNRAGTLDNVQASGSPSTNEDSSHESAGSRSLSQEQSAIGVAANAPKTGELCNNNLCDEDIFSKEFDSLIDSEKSIVSKLFYGMYTNMMKCRQCGFKKHKSDLMMMLPLAIPNEMRYHPSVTLIRFSEEMPMKILAPLNATIQEVLGQVKVEYGIKNDILPVEYSDSQPVEFIPETKTVKSVFNRIHLYEYSSGKKFYLCKMFHYRYLFFKSKLPIDILIEESDKKMNIFNKLRPYFAKNFSFEEFLSQVTVSQQSTDTVYNLPVVEVAFKDPRLLFGVNFELLSKPVSQKSDDLGLQDCLDYCFKPERIELYCENCQGRASYEMRSKLTKHPKYLIIHLKRFSYSVGGTKINTFVDFPTDNFKIEDHMYRLVGTSNHLEIGLGYGHYVSYVRKNNQWYCCNDSVISKAIYPDKATAYILFYEKVG